VCIRSSSSNNIWISVTRHCSRGLFTNCNLYYFPMCVCVDQFHYSISSSQMGTLSIHNSLSNPIVIFFRFVIYSLLLLHVLMSVCVCVQCIASFMNPDFIPCCSNIAAAFRIRRRRRCCLINPTPNRLRVYHHSLS